MFAALVLLARAAYSAPGDYDALAAIGRRFSEDAASRTASLYQYEIESSGHYPAFVRVLRCEPSREDETVSAVGSDFGHWCIVEITPNLEAPYVTRGRFVRDVGGWRYHGPLSETPLENFDYYAPHDAGMAGKPGSTIYDGDFFAHSDDNARSPYHGVLNQLGVPGY
jgi:hypothetical protein